mmetsp:Transcript_15770/g.48807  ORF Transcript_15770/g.48807 Transcript_15770/m.48807 type:complete len:266 (-) Transcript_15770:145-942(-)
MVKRPMPIRGRDVHVLDRAIVLRKGVTHVSLKLRGEQRGKFRGLVRRRQRPRRHRRRRRLRGRLRGRLGRRVRGRLSRRARGRVGRRVRGPRLHRRRVRHRRRVGRRVRVGEGRRVGRRVGHRRRRVGARRRRVRRRRRRRVRRRGGGRGGGRGRLEPPRFVKAQKSSKARFAAGGPDRRARERDYDEAHGRPCRGDAAGAGRNVAGATGGSPKKAKQSPRRRGAPIRAKLVQAPRVRPWALARAAPGAGVAWGGHTAFFFRESK